MTATATGVHVFPCSFQQQRFWVLDQINPGAALYTMPAAYRLRGSLDPAALEAALDRIVERHEALRTVFALEGEAPVQIVRPHERIALPVSDFREHSAADREAAAAQAYRDMANRPFDLAGGPLLRAALFRLDEAEWVFAIVVHHIAADGVSMGLLTAELERCYAAFASGETPDLPPLSLQYPDFAVWQRKQAEGNRMERQLAWWRERLAGPLPVLDLPADRPRPPQQSFRGGRRTSTIPAAVADAIRELGRREGATPFMTFLAAFQALLQRHAGQDDLIVGVITSGRQRREVEPLIGLFLNTLAIRTDLSGEPTFRELVGRVRDAALGALDNQDVPFDLVAEAVEPAADRSRSPIFQVGFQLLEGIGKDLTLPGLAVEPLRAVKHSAPFDLTLFLFGGDPSGALRATFDYSTDLFDAETADRLLARYGTLLESVVRDPSQLIGRLDLLPAAERALVLTTWNATHAPAAEAVLLHEGFERQADSRPDAPALAFDGGTLSYAELERRANRLAWRLAALGAGPGTGVGICAKPSPDALTAILATLKTGAHYVPLDPDSPAERLAFLVADSGVRVLLREPQTAGGLPAAGPVTLELAGLDAPGPDHRLERRASPDDLAYVIYTSGSTGLPKGVMVTHRAAANTVSAFGADYGVTDGDAVLQTHPLVFDPSVWTCFVPLHAGGRAVIPSPGAEHLPTLLLEAVRRHGVTILPLVPSLLQLLLDGPGLGECLTLRRIFCGGEVLTGDLLRRTAEVLPGAAVTNLYGPTESTIYVSQWSWDRRPFDGAAPIGRPIRNCRVYVLDPAGRPVPAGVPGEAYLAGAGVARGYLNRPDLEREKFLPDRFRPGDRMYRSGDLVRWRADGQLEFLGRLDDQVKLRGFRIELGEIEAVLGAAPGVQGAAVMVREDVPGDRRLVAYVAAAGPTPPALAAVREHSRNRLPEYMVPSHIVVLPSLPLTPNGKVDRKALPVPDAHESEVLASEPPRSALEREIAVTMEGVLRRGPIGRDDDFFRLGGHSLLAMRLLGRVRAALAPELGLQAIFEHPTVAGLAAVIEAAGGARGGAARIPRRPDRTRAPLSFAQEMLWVQAAMEPGLPSYNVPLILRLDGALDADALEAAVTALAARHEPLRTAFVLEGGEPVQLIRAPAPVVLERVDLSAAADPGSEALSRARETAGRQFDLGRGSLLRAALYRLGPHLHHLLLVTHHIATDGWSMSILVDDLAALYEAAAAGRSGVLAPLPLQYGDVAVWERERLTGERMERLLGFWKGYLAGAPSALALPTDRPYTAAGTGMGARCSTTLPTDMLERLRQVGEGVGATLYMTLLSVWATLLHRYSGQSDILIGTPVAGRDRPETEGLVGFFINTLMLRVTLDPDAPFQQQLEQVRRVCVDAFAHDEMPLGHLAQVLRAEGDDAPWFQVTFTLQGAPGTPRPFPGLRAEPSGVHLGSANFALGLIVQESPAGLAVSLEYRTDLFDRVTIERMLGHLRTLIQGIVEGPRLAIHRLPVLTEPERRQMLVEWNGARVAYSLDATMHGLVEAQARSTPDAVAVADGNRALTYAELDQQANALAAEIVRADPGPSGLVGVCLERQVDLVVGLLAVLKAGCAYVPLDPAYPAQRLRFILDDSAARVVVTQASLVGDVAAEGVTLVLIEGPRRSEVGSAPAGRGTSRAKEPAYVIYTSGSTGLPKGVVISHRNAVAFIAWAQTVFSQGDLAGVLAATSVCFDLSVFEIFVTLSSGGTVVMVPNALHLHEATLPAPVTLVNTVPSVMEEVLRAGPLAHSVRVVNLAGEPLSQRLVEQLYAHPDVDRVYDLYGPSEDTTYSTYTLRRRGGRATIGRPIANSQAYVLDPWRQPVAIGVPGELYLGGDGVALGYLNRAELTAERFLQDPFNARSGARMYRTGDLVRYLPDGNLEYLGRLDHQVKVRGFRIELGEIEVALGGHADISAVVVIVREDTPGDRRLVAYVVGRSGATLEKAALRQHLRAALPDHMIPASFVRLPALPLTANGKVDRKALPAPAADDDDAESSLAPRTPLEEAVAGIFAEVLGRTRVGVTTSFFELGGHSLLATQVVGRASRLFQVKVSLRDFFEAPTVAALAAVVVQRLAAQDAAASSDAELAALLAELEGLSEDDAARLLTPETPEIS